MRYAVNNNHAMTQGNRHLAYFNLVFSAQAAKLAVASEHWFRANYRHKEES
jgi:hypothetical protein